MLAFAQEWVVFGTQRSFCQVGESYEKEQAQETEHSTNFEQAREVEAHDETVFGVFGVSMVISCVYIFAVVAFSVVWFAVAVVVVRNICWHGSRVCSRIVCCVCIRGICICSIRLGIVGKHNFSAVEFVVAAVIIRVFGSVRFGVRLVCCVFDIVPNAWFNHLVEVEPVSETNQTCNKTYRSECAFRAIHEQNKERQNEIDDDIEVENRFELLEAEEEILCFLTVVGVPNQHELRKPKVSPKDAKTEDIFAQVVHVVFAKILQQTARLEESSDKQNDRYRADPQTYGCIPSEKRAIPVRIDRHDPKPNNVSRRKTCDRQENSCPKTTAEQALFS